MTLKTYIMVKKKLYPFLDSLGPILSFWHGPTPGPSITFCSRGAPNLRGHQLSKEWLSKKKIDKARDSNSYIYNHVIPLSHSRKKIYLPHPPPKPSEASLSQFLRVCSTICIFNWKCVITSSTCIYRFKCLHV